MGVSCGGNFRDTWDRASDRCSRIFPCFSDPARRSALTLKLALVVLHLVLAGVIFLFDNDLIVKTKQEPWYTAVYVVLFVATLIQYFVTSGTSPGYVFDVQRAIDERDAAARRASFASIKDNQLQAKMTAFQSPWMEETIIEEMQQPGQS